MTKRKLSYFVEILLNVADKWHTKRIRKFYGNQFIDLVIDVGSHKGEFIDLIVDDNTPIFSFEPQSSVREKLVKSTKSKNVIEYFDCALSTYEGNVELYLNELTSTTSTLPPNQSNWWIKFKRFILGGELVTGTENVRVSRLDKVLGNRLTQFNNILLKIDVEGAEGRVLLGAKGLFDNNRIKFVQIESANYSIYNSREEDPSIILSGYGFKVCKRFVFPLLNFTDIVFEKR